jgi:prepilin-type N-terminal cleavage/methylation domain-containing protein
MKTLALAPRATPGRLHPRRPAPGRTRGFTAIEVLIAMTIMAIGAGAVMSMQKASIQGNLDARKADVANSIARMWVERLRRDAMQWTLVAGNGNATIINNQAAKLLALAPDQWAFPDSYMNVNTASPVMSYAFDILGRDLAQSEIGQTVFCVNVKLTPVTPTLVRANVRVLWPRGITGAAPQFCLAVDPGLETGADTTLYHAIYTTTAVSVNASQAQ